jgi:hypothetical protein
MNNWIERLTLVVAVTASTFLAAADEADQAEFPQVTAQPLDQAIPLGGEASLTVESQNSEAYQWLRNGVIIEGQTNNTLIIKNVGTNDVGYYSCALLKGDEVVSTRNASLNAYTLDAGGEILVYGSPVHSSGSQGSCPGAYAGYVSFTKTISQGWGWAPDANTTVHTASDQNRSDTKVVFTGKYGDGGCEQTTSTISDPTYSPKYRFTVYFPNNVPTNSYAITLSGFLP